MQQKINDQTAETDGKLKKSNLAAVHLTSAVQQGTDIVPDKAGGDRQQNTVFDHDKQRLYLGKAVGSFLRDRLVKQRYQQKKRSDHDQIRYVKNTVHQQGM